jgi:hypothetical protein
MIALRNDELQRWIRALEHLLVWSLDHPAPVSFPAMMEPLPDEVYRFTAPDLRVTTPG